MTRAGEDGISWTLYVKPFPHIQYEIRLVNFITQSHLN
jgi:hypothetical protein